MMFKSSSAQGDLNGFLDAGSHMTGELHFEDTFRIDGKFTGSVVSDGDLIVGEKGDVDGEIRVRRVFVSGTVRGVLRSSERVEITAAGKVMADLYTPSLAIDDGAFFEGRCSMERLEKTSGEAGRKVAQMPFAKSVKPGS
ncbi:MAG: polymer-forming cytoskeletal protein [bacterium]|nr:polymer-forming cytoskeletal protein [bacterium]